MATNQDDPGPSGVLQDPAVTTPVTVVSTPEAGQDWFGPQGDLRNLQEGLAAFDEQVREGRQSPDRRRRLEQPPGLTGQVGPPLQGGHLMDAEELRQSLQSITGICKDSPRGYKVWKELSRVRQHRCSRVWLQWTRDCRW